MKSLGVFLLAGSILQAGIHQAEVARVFAAVRKGNAAAVSQLVRLGTAAIPDVAPYTKDRNERVRREAVAVLNGIGGAEVCAPLLEALADSSQDVRDRAALSAWRHCDRGELPQIAGGGDLLARAALADHGTAAAILLLGYFPGERTRAVLSKMDGKRQTKLEPWHPLLQEAVARDMALLRLGENGARERLKAALSDAAAAVFLLRASRDIENREVLGWLAGLLGDERRSPGVGAEGEPPLRVCDVAVESLVARFGLKPTFPLGVRRYTPHEREEAAKLAKREISAL